MHHHIVAFGHDDAVIPSDSRWKRLHQPEQPLSPRGNMPAVLDIVRRPHCFRGCKVSLVEQGIEALDDESLILLLKSLIHGFDLNVSIAPCDRLDPTGAFGADEISDHWI